MIQNFTSLGKLARYSLPGKISLFMSGPCGQLEGCWLLPKYTCHYCNIKMTVVFIGAIARWSIGCFPPFELAEIGISSQFSSGISGPCV